MVSLLEQINKFSNTQYMAIDLVNASCSIPLKKQNQQYVFM